MQMCLMLWDEKALILLSLPFKVLIGCNMGIFMPWRRLEFIVGLERTSSCSNFAHLTNFRRSKWGVGISPLCSICGREDETTIHVLRDCDYAIQVWLHLVPFHFIIDFFTFDCRDWIFNNLGKCGICATTKNWKTIFMTSCWFLWTWRKKVSLKMIFTSQTTLSWWSKTLLER